MNNQQKTINVIKRAKLMKITHAPIRIQLPSTGGEPLILASQQVPPPPIPETIAEMLNSITPGEAEASHDYAIKEQLPETIRYILGCISLAKGETKARKLQ